MNLSSILSISFAALGLGATAIVGAASTFAEAELEQSKDIIAAQIRDQGFACDKALGAERDRAASRPNEAVWTLICENASYRVRLVPNMAAHVERLPDNAPTGTGKETQQ
jgi:hypothetical protein